LKHNFTGLHYVDHNDSLHFVNRFVNEKIKEIQNTQLEMDDKNFDLVVVFGSIYMLGLVFKDFQDFFAAQNPD